MSSSNDRTGLCTFTFDDGRHCNMPHLDGDLRLCFFHEKREVQRRLAIDAGVKISRFLGTNLHTASDLNNTFAMLFRAGAQGYLEPKAINALTRLGHLLLKTHTLAKEEYLASHQDEWSNIVLQSISYQCDPEPAPQSVPGPANSDHLAAPTEIELLEPTMDIPFPKIPPPESPTDEPTAAGLPSTTSESPNDPPPDHGTHQPHPQPTHRELFRYLRYLQRHSHQPQPNLTPCRMSRSKSSTKQNHLRRPQPPVNSTHFPNHVGGPRVLGGVLRSRVPHPLGFKRVRV